MVDNFPIILQQFRIRAGLSQNALAKEVGVHASYINRIENGEREPPRRDIVQSMGQALSLNPFELDELLLSADYAPQIAEEIDLSNPMLRLMAELLDDDEASPEELVDQFLRIIEQKQRQINDESDE